MTGATVVGVHGRGVHAHQHLGGAGARPVDLAQPQAVRRAEPLLDHCLHSPATIPPGTPGTRIAARGEGTAEAPPRPVNGRTQDPPYPSAGPGRRSGPGASAEFVQQMCGVRRRVRAALDERARHPRGEMRCSGAQHHGGQVQ